MQALVERTGVDPAEIDDVIVNIGGVLPTPFLESIGIEVETKFGTVAKSRRRGSGSQGAA